MQNHDLGLHHDLTPGETKAGEDRVQKMITFTKRHENPFHINQQALVPELYNFLNQEKATDQIRKLGADFCKVIPVVYALTDCDI